MQINPGNYLKTVYKWSQVYVISYGSSYLIVPDQRCSPTFVHCFHGKASATKRTCSPLEPRSSCVDYSVSEVFLLSSPCFSPRLHEAIEECRPSWHTPPPPPLPLGALTQSLSCLNTAGAYYQLGCPARVFANCQPVLRQNALLQNRFIYMVPSLSSNVMGIAW